MTKAYFSFLRTQVLSRSGVVTFSAALWKKFQQQLSLPEKEQRAVIRLINSLVGTKSDDADAA